MKNLTLFKSTIFTFIASYFIAIPSAFILGRLVSRVVWLTEKTHCAEQDCIGFAILSMLLYFLMGIIVYTISFFLIMRNKKKKLLKENIILRNSTIFGLYGLTVILGFFFLKFIIPLGMIIFFNN
ncbi:MAG: hypothetical protein KBB91_00435 [Candidatus Pacebacteria bacterium]|nr:hypothetical protein [Candidatus Paceibacterota bacterium]MBP9700862.1 hypothetical protein [Candidatus Paceibacterota bacterium]